MFYPTKEPTQSKGGFIMDWDEESMQAVRDVVAGNITKYRASLKLGVHVRTVERKARAYRVSGEQCFVHGNKGKEPSNKADLDTVMKYIRDHDLSGGNFTEVCRIMAEYGHISISPSCMRKRYFAEGLLSVKCKRKTRKKMKKILRELKKAEEITREKMETLSALEHEEASGVWNHPTKPRSKFFGERLEMDASSFVWVKGLGTCTLHACIDDASGFLVALWIEQEETLHGYYKLMEQVLTFYGIPLSIRTDKRTVFIYNKRGGGLGENDTMTQFAYACSKLGVELSCNSDPDFKPKVERANQTLQGMLPFRISMEKITTLQQANEYLQSSFIPYFNNLFGYDFDYVGGKKRKIESVFVKCSPEEIRNTLAVLCERTVNKGSSIQLENAYMALLDEKGRRIALPYHTKVTVARLLDGSLFATKGDRCYALEEIPERYAFSEKVEPDSARPKPSSPKPKVPANHPWSFQRQMKFKQSDALMKSLDPYYKSPSKSRYA
jgi:hypothetical protein